MKAVFITSITYPSSTANRIHIFSMAKAFARKGVSIDLLCRKVSNIHLPSQIKKIQLGTGKSLTSAWKYAGFLKNHKHDFWFIREPHLMLLTILFYLLRARKTPPYIIYEIHDMPRDFFDGFSLRILLLLKKHKVIVITKLLKDDLISMFPAVKSNIEVLPDGVDLGSFSFTSNQNQLIFKEDPDRPLVVYTGSLFAWKGVRYLVDCARLLPQVNFWIIGGYEKDILSLKEMSHNLQNFKVWGYVEHDKISSFLNVADILVLPNSATYRMSEKYTSPLKLFEYMASGKPILASKLPSIEEILQDNVNAYLIDPDNPQAIADGIKRVLADSSRERITLKAKNDVIQYSWDSRVEKILKSITV